MKRLPILAALLILTACTAPITATPSPSPTATLTTSPPTSTSTAIPTPTTTPSPTVYASPTFPVFPTATITPTPTEYGRLPPTPAHFLYLYLSRDFLFGPSNDPTCQLPCWQGLRVGESNRQDIQGVLDTVFQFNGTVDHFKDNPLDELTILVLTSDLPGTEAVGYEWVDTSKEDNNSSFVTYFIVDESSGILQGINFGYYPKGMFRTYTPQEVIEKLGIPSYLASSVFKMGAEGVSDVGLITNLRLIYKDGIAFDFSYWVLVQSRNTTDGEKEVYAEYCLDGIKLDIGGDVYIVAPFTDLFEDELNPIQEMWIYDLVDMSGAVPGWYYEIADSKGIIESRGELFGVSTEEFAETALQVEHPCLEINVSALGE